MNYECIILEFQKLSNKIIPKLQEIQFILIMLKSIFQGMPKILKQKLSG